MAFFDNIKFPFFTMQELNLDWIMNTLKTLVSFMPTGGNAGDVLTRKTDGAAWEPPEAVNINIDALPQDTAIVDNDELIFYDKSAQANRKITPPDLLDSMCSNAYPLMNGTAAAGTSKKPARYDHVHPVDTSRAPVSYFENAALKIANGGTGATNARNARISLQVPGWYSAVLPANSSVSVTSADSQICCLAVVYGRVQAGFGTLAFVGGYVSGTRITVTPLVSDGFITYDTSSPDDPVFTISNSSNTDAFIAILDFTGFGVTFS